MKNASILVVDDEPFNFVAIQALLDDEGYDLHYAPCGQAALDGLESFDPDLILLDVIMPDMDGIEFCRRIKTLPEWQTVPILMVTALSDKEDLARCLNEGADDFLSKPVNPHEIRARVQSMLRIKRQYDRIKSLSQAQTATIDLLKSSLNELRNNVVMSLPHELNTSLNGIAGIIDLLMSRLMLMSIEEIHDLLAMARESSLRLEKLIHRFLVYLQLEIAANDPKGKKKHKVGIASFESRQFLEFCAKQQSQVDQRASDLVCDLQEANIMAHAMDLKFIIEELLTNAFKFSKPGNPVVIRSEIVGEDLVIGVEDSGRGMTVQQIDKVGAFMQFERGYYEQQGTGLGLEIIKKLTLIHQWALSVESINRQGTTIRIAVPLAS